MAGFWDKLKLTFSSPDKLFESIRDEGVGSSLLFPLYIFLAATAIGLSQNIFSHYSSDFFGMYFGVGGSIAYLIVSNTVFLVSLFILTGILHGVSLLLGAREGFGQTIKVSAYSSVPFLIVSVIVSGLLQLALTLTSYPSYGIYSIYNLIFLLAYLVLIVVSLGSCAVLVVKGLVKLQGLSVGKGVAAVLSLFMLFMLTILPLLLLLFLFIRWFPIRALLMRL